MNHIQISTGQPRNHIESFDEKIVRLFLQGTSPADIGKRCGTPSADIRARLVELGHDATAKSVNGGTSVWDMSPERQRQVFAQRAARAARQALGLPQQRHRAPPVEIAPTPEQLADLEAIMTPPTFLVGRWKSIIMEVAEKHSLRAIDIISRRQDRPTTTARQEAMYRMHHETTLSDSDIARRLGGRDHTTILYGIKKHAQRLADARGGAA